MKLDAAAYHEIINVTLNVAVSPAEAETWKKCLLVTADEKIKLHKSQLTVNLLRNMSWGSIPKNVLRGKTVGKDRGERRGVIKKEFLTRPVRRKISKDMLLQ